MGECSVSPPSEPCDAPPKEPCPCPRKEPILKRFLNWCKSDCSPCRRKARKCRTVKIKKGKCRDPLLTYGCLIEPDPCKCWKPGCSTCLPCFEKYKCIREMLLPSLQLLDNRCDRLRAVKWLTFPGEPCRLRSGRVSADEGSSGDTPKAAANDNNNVGSLGLMSSPPVSGSPKLQERPAAGGGGREGLYHHPLKSGVYSDKKNDGDEEEEEEEEDDEEEESESEESEEEDDDDVRNKEDDIKLSEEWARLSRADIERRFVRKELSSPLVQQKRPPSMTEIVCKASSSDESGPKPVPRTRTLQLKNPLTPTPPPRHFTSRVKT